MSLVFHSLSMRVALCLVFFSYLITPAWASFINFESGHVRPMALSPDGNTLIAANTPDGHIEVFAVRSDGLLQHQASVPVGLEPVAVEFRDDTEAWVVNHLSDSISVIDLSREFPTVTRTLLVGDEPRDIVFAGPNRNRAFISTAHRGQHRTHSSIQSVPGSGDPRIHDASVSRADVWVFDALNLGAELGGRPLRIVELFGDTPRGLAVSNDGNTVYVAVFNSGNQTSVVHESVMCFGFEDTPAGPQGTGQQRAGNEPCVTGNLPPAEVSSSPSGLPNNMLPGGRPLPSINVDGEDQPWTSMIVKFNRETGQWEDSRGLNYSNGIRFFLPDHDVFAVDANTLEQISDFEHVGTTLFNMAVNPVNGNIYVSNTDANNATRFEGPGEFGGSTVQGEIALARITVIDPSTGSVRPRHINRHIDYSILKSPASVKQHTVSTPLEMRVSSDGSKLYVASIGSDRVAVYNTADLENDALWDGVGTEFDPAAISNNHLPVTGGPSGIMLDEQHNGNNGQLFVLSRFDNSVRVIDAVTGAQRQQVAMYNPEPADVSAGRFMLYDAVRSSSNGESSCASCHVFGDMDHLAWNLGNPDGANTENAQPFPNFNLVRLSCDLLGPSDPGCQFLSLLNGTGNPREFASMKGPMTTQTMRGMSTHGHMHWRGDRVTGYFGTDSDPNNDEDNNPDTRDLEALDERLSFKNFIVAFEGLLGLDIDLPTSVDAANKSADVVLLEQDMERFADFMLSVQLPPNPIRGLDNSLSPSAQIGQSFFHGTRRGDGSAEDFAINGPEPDGVNCEGCHAFDPAKGFYGTDGGAATGGEVQILKVPHFRNLYQRVGMFGLPSRNGFLPSTTDGHQGDQIRGFGFLHDGATDKLFNFLLGGVFDDGETNCSDLGLSGDHFGCETNIGFIGVPDDAVRQGLVDYMMEFDSDLAPVVGQQITLSATTGSAMNQRLQLLETRAATPFISKVLGGNVTECDLVAQGVVDGELRGYLYQAETSDYRSDRRLEPILSSAEIRTLATTASNHLTFTCHAPGTGTRIALDRDEDGVFNTDERDRGSNPANANSVVGGFSIAPQLSGSWFDPTHDGEGWTLQIQDDQTAVIAWYTFDPEGNPAWLIGTGRTVNDELVFEELIITSGGIFGPDFDPDLVQRDVWGSLRMAFNGCNSAQIDYQGPENWGSGKLNAVALTKILGYDCGASNPPEQSRLTGIFFDPARDGEGWFVEVIDQGALVYWYTYDLIGRQQWFVGLGSINGNQVVVNQMNEVSGGVFGPDFDPEQIVRSLWGSITVSYDNCSGFDLSYTARSPFNNGGPLPGQRLLSVNGLECTP